MKNQETTNPEVLKIVDLLFKTYKCVLLSKKQCAWVTNQSVSNLDRDRLAGRGIQFLQQTPTSNVYYSIYDIAEYIYKSKIQTYQGIE